MRRRRVGGERLVIAMLRKYLSRQGWPRWRCDVQAHSGDQRVPSGNRPTVIASIVIAYLLERENLVTDRHSQAVRSFYNHQAEAYDKLMESTPDNALMRHAFWELVDDRLTRGAAILDLGAGTGQDARYFAEAGHRVLAYDVSERMIQLLTRRCSDLIKAGHVVPVSGHVSRLTDSLQDFGGIQAITANFAVINLVPDLTFLSAFLLSRLPDCRWIFLAAQNPFYVKDMRSLWWWKGLLLSPVSGAIVHQNAAVATYRHFLGSLRSAVGPEFSIDAQWSLVGKHIRKHFPLNRLGHLRLLAYRRYDVAKHR